MEDLIVIVNLKKINLRATIEHIALERKSRIICYKNEYCLFFILIFITKIKYKIVLLSGFGIR